MRANVNGTEIYFDVDGPHLGVHGLQLRARPTLVALHGGPGFDHGYLKPGLGPLRESAQIVYVDLRGQGRSGRPQLDSCTLEQMADDVAALCAHVGIERPVVFGHSAGGFVALHLALRHPELTCGLILCDTLPTHVPIDDDVPRPTLASRADPEVLAASNRMFGGDMSPESLAEFSAKVGPFYSGPSHMDVPGQILGLSGMSVDLMQYYFSKLAPRYDLRSRLGEIKVPTLVITGRHDWVCPPAASRAMARAIPNAKLVELAESGHFGFSEEPALFQAAVRAFLAESP
jgi:proline iminopeptidase